MKLSINVLSENNYLISPELQELLTSDSSNIKPLVEGKDGIYLVKIKVLNKNEGTLIYNYIHYSPVFHKSLLYFIISKKDFNNSLTYSEWGDFLTVVDNNLCSDCGEDKLELNTSNIYLNRTWGLQGNVEYDIVNYNELFSFINRLLLSGNYEDLASLVHLSFIKDYKGVINLMFGGASNYIVGNNIIYWDSIIENELVNIDVLSGCLFVVRDLDGLVDSIKGKGYLINQGPKRWRGQVNSMSNFLSLFDVDYRNSLYRHNQYHVSKGSIEARLALNKSKFSFRNVHQNISGVKWYSTNTPVKKPSKSVSNRSLRQNTPVYSYLNDWLAKSPINNDTQEALEKYLLDYTYVGIDGKDNPLVDYSLISGRLSKLLFAKKTLLSSIIDNFRKLSININKPRINQKDKSRYYLNVLLLEVSNEEIIAIMYGRLMRIITRYNRFYHNSSVIDIFHDITDNLIKDYWFSLYNKYIDNLYIESKVSKDYDGMNEYEIKRAIENKKMGLRKVYTLSNWKRDNVNYVYVFKDPTLKSYIGGIVIEWMIEVNLIQNKVIILGKKEKNTIYIPTDEVMSCIDTKQLVHLPVRVPMIVKPKPYYRETINGVINERLGGYLLNDYKTSDKLIIENWELKEPSNIKDVNVVYDLVNNMNSVGYKINKDVLNFIDKYGVDMNLIIYEESPLLNKPNLRKRDKIELESYQNKVELQENILGLARVYSQVHEFYLPVRIDNRGRMYCISEYLNYQSTELAKSLLLFSKAEKIKKTDNRAINYLKAFGANCYGNKLDKKSWNERTKWIDDNVKDIINFENGKLISQATNKLLFIAFCFEYNRFLKSLSNIDSTYFDTYLPIQLDATCNGYQHLSLLSLDLSLAKELNLVTSTWSDLPKDFYNYLSTNLIGWFKNKLKDNNITEEEREDYMRLSVLHIARTIIKKAIMTIPYNVSLYQMIKYIKENFKVFEDDEENKEVKCKDKWYRFIDDPSIKLKSRDFVTIATGLREVLGNNFFKLKSLMKYLKETAKICTKLDLAIPWGLPSGVVVKQSYLATNEVRLKPFSYSKSKFTIKVANKEKFNSQKQIRAFMPNLVHSLDAASLAMLVDLYFNKQLDSTKNIYAIHDCFAVTANNVENIMELLKLVYIQIYSEGNYLKQLDLEIKHQIKIHYGDDCFNEEDLSLKIPDLPKIKYPDINEVLGIKLPNLDPKVLKGSSYLIN